MKAGLDLEALRELCPQDAALIDQLAAAKVFFYDGPGIIISHGRKLSGEQARTLVAQAGYNPMAGTRSDPLPRRAVRSPLVTFLNTLEVAMWAEGSDPEAGLRVLNRMIYGDPLGPPADPAAAEEPHA